MQEHIKINTNFIKKILRGLIFLSVIVLSACGKPGEENAVDAFLGSSTEGEPPPIALNYSTTVFQEREADGGIFDGTITITLENDTFNGSAGEDFVDTGRVSVSNIPAGLSAVITKSNATSLIFSLAGFANNHSKSDDVSNVIVTFSDSAFLKSPASKVVDASKGGIQIKFNILQVAYSRVAFTENTANDGTIKESALLTLSGDKWTSGIGVDMATDSNIVVISNIPGGLTAEIKATSENQAQLNFIGTATQHTDVQDVNNITVQFKDGAFQTNPAADIDFSTRTDLSIDFFNPGAISYNTKVFNEHSDNDGKIGTTISISLTQDVFTGSNTSNFITDNKVTVTGVPSGLTAKVIKQSSTLLYFTLEGVAASHLDANDIPTSTITVTFDQSAFTNSADVTKIDNYTINDIEINYNDPVSIIYDGTTFNESTQNIGRTTDTITFTVVNDTFNGNGSENLVSTGKVTLPNLPTGFVAVMNVDNTTQATLSFTYGASDHADADDLNSFQVVFLANAFTNSTLTSNITDSDKNDFVINFYDPYELSFSATKFNEANVNDGTITETITITVAGTTFNGFNGTDLTAQGVSVGNVPSGLTAKVLKDSNTSLSFTLVGTADNHINVNDIYNLSLTFSDSNFSSGSMSGVTNSNKPDFQIDFSDPTVLSYDTTIFTEANANSGGIGSKITITIANDTFTGLVGANYVPGQMNVTNLPAGLTGISNKISNSVIEVTIAGQTTPHDNAATTNDIRIQFFDGAFSNVPAAGVTNADRSDITLSFADPYVITFSASQFVEGDANDGSVDDTFQANLVGATAFTGNTSDDFVADGKILVTNLPSGLTLVATKQNNTRLLFSFDGKADNHAPTNDLTNLTLEFQDNAFTSNDKNGVTDSTKTDFAISFESPPDIEYLQTSFSENAANLGGSSDAINLVLTNKTYNGNVNDDLYAQGKVTVNGLPSGLTAVMTVASPNLVTVTLAGKADSHVSTDNVGNIEFIFLDSAFTGGNAAEIVNYTYSTISMSFLNPYSIGYSKTDFIESNNNDGSIPDTSTITLIGTGFTGNPGDDFVADSKLTITNLPDGLTAKALKNSDSQLTLSFTGNASQHINTDDVPDLTLTFEDNAFVSNAALGVQNYTKNNFTIDFKNTASISPDGGTFSEASSNIGTIDTTITLTLTDDTFTGVNGDDFIANGYATVTQLPSSLSATLKRTSATTLQFKLTGTADSHESGDNVTDLGLTLNSTAFAFNSDASAVSGSEKLDYQINFTNGYSIAYPSTIFTESSANDGSMGNTLAINLTGTTFVGSNGTDFIAGGFATVENVPSGLTADLIHNTTTSLTLSLTGKATNHLDTNDKGDIKITLLDGAFSTGAAAGVSGTIMSTVNIDFNDQPSIAYSASTFTEDESNIGDFSETITITLTGETLKGFDGQDFIAAGMINANNLPSGLTAKAQRTSTTTLDLTLVGSATSHLASDTINTVEIEFTTAAINNVLPVNVTDSVKSDFDLIFRAPYTISYSGTGFVESEANDGSVTQTIVITLNGTTFAGSNGNDFEALNYVSVGNVPTGLTAIMSRDSDTQLTLSLTQNANFHANSNDVNTLSVTFNNSAFTIGEASGVDGRDKSNLTIDFFDKDTLTYDTSTFKEDTTNDGVTSTTITITLSGDTFDGAINSDFINDSKLIVTNVPDGLTAVSDLTTTTTLEVTLTGTASQHANANDVPNLTFEFQNSAFVQNSDATNVTNYLRNNLNIDYNDQATLSYSTGTFAEANSNDGSISNIITITLSGDTFTGGASEDYIGNSKVTVANEPAGLTATATRTSATTVDIAFTGKATDHSSSDNKTNFTVTFAGNAFTATSQNVDVIGYTKNNIAITFDAAAALSFASNTFSEALSNDGAIATTVLIDLLADTFDGTDGDDFINDTKITPNNVPTGLTAIAEKISDSQIAIRLEGKADSHANGNDISDLSFTFLNAAFVNNTAVNVVNYANTQMVIDFADPANISYSATTLNEIIGNNGTITQKITLNLSGDTFTGTNAVAYDGTKVTFNNVPDGLTAVLTKATDTTATLELTGTASQHTNDDDINNLVVTFTAAAFTNNSVASNVNGYTNTGISVNFDDPAVISYDASVFYESINNDGTIASTVSISITGDKFNGTPTDDFVNDGKIFVGNMPSGITAVAEMISDTQIKVRIEGTADLHSNASDITNLTLTFQDGAFVNNSTASTVNGYLKNDLHLNFLDPANIIYSTLTYNEAPDNTGAITEEIVLTLVGDTFNATISQGTEIDVQGVPSGLTATITRDDANNLTIGFTGTANNHENDNDTNITIEFLNGAFVNNANASAVNNYLKSDVSVDFIDKASLAFSTNKYTEVLGNTGAITNSIVITLSGDTFASPLNLTSHVTVTTVPTGLTADVTRNGDKQVTIALTGSAQDHENANDSPLTITFLDAAFTDNAAANITNYSRSDISIDFQDAASIAYSASAFNESAANTGLITETITLTLSGDTFVDPIAIDTDLTIAGVPSGLTAKITRENDNELSLYFDGVASPHTADESTQLTITFATSAFENSADATQVVNYLKSDLDVNFNDAASIFYSSSVFSEASSNDGSITDTITITLTGDKFVAGFTKGTHLQIDNVPTGLTAEVSRDTDKQLTLSLTGNASGHASTDNVSLTYTFKDGAFVNNSTASAVNNYVNSNIDIVYDDGATLAYSRSTFNETSANGGAIAETATITLTGDTFNATISQGVHVNVTGVPNSLTANVVRENDNEISLYFTGTADSHVNINDAPFTVTFLNGAFTNNATASSVAGYNRADLNLNFDDPASISYNTSSFKEVNANTGAISNIITLTLSGDTFNSSIIKDTHISFANVPSGLTADVTRTGDTEVEIDISGNAVAHEDADDTTMEITFLNGAFVNNSVAASVVNYQRTDVEIDYKNAPSLSYNTNIFKETKANIGEITQEIVITLTGDKFAANIDIATQLIVTGEPAGLTANVTRTGDYTVKIGFDGKATSHSNSEDQTLTYAFQDGAFVNTTAAANVNGNSRNDINLDFDDPASLSYSSTAFNEVATNTGALAETITITISGDTFVTPFAMNSEVTVGVVPSGLTANVNRTGANEIKIWFTGSADSHLNADDKSVTITFLDGAFTNNATASAVNGYQNANITLDFDDPTSIAYNLTSFEEDTPNDGSISNAILLNLTGDTFNATIALATQITVAPVPGGLTAVVTRMDDQQVKVEFTGKATSHAAGDSTTTTIAFQNGAFTNTSTAANVNNYSKVVDINYVNPAKLSYNTNIFYEAPANTGAITQTITITLEDDTFVTPFNINSEVTVAPVPAGLTAQATRQNANEVTLYFTGSATAHANADDIALTVTFLDGAFTNNASAASVDNYERTDVYLDFDSAAAIAYNTSTFREVDANTGAIDNDIIITLTGDTFNGTIDKGVDLIFTTIPSGLTANISTDTDQKLTISITGTADNHEDVNDVNVDFTFANSAFTKNTASNVLNSSRSDINFDYQDAASLSYSTGTFKEASSNIGEITETITITLTGDTFAGTIASPGQVIVGGLPSNLTAVATQTGDYEVELTLTGSATAHENLNDAPLTVTFQNGAFTNNATAAEVNGYQKVISLDFDNKAVLSYSSGVFFENLANDGAITQEIIITLEGDTFTGTIGVPAQLDVQTLPSGLTATASKVDDNHVKITFTGSANAHENDNDQTLTYTFQNGAFTNNAAASNVTGYTRNDIKLDFADKAAVSYSAGTFKEDSTNTGEFSETITITLTGDKFASTIAVPGQVTVGGLPANLTAVTTQISDYEVELTLTGSASAHEDINDAPLTVQFQNGAFINNTTAADVTRYQQVINLDFDNKAALSYSGSVFFENIANDGAITQEIIITLEGDKFAGTIGVPAQLDVQTLPTGLTATATKIDDYNVKISFTGSASVHENDNDQTLTYIFQNGAFVNNAIAANVDGYSRNDIKLDFADKASLAYSANYFQEDISNIGEFSETITITLAGDKFAGTIAVPGQVTVGGLPSNLTAVATQTGDYEVELTLTGSASAHENLNDAPLTVTFLNGAFTNNTSAADVTAYQKVINLDFEDKASLSYNGSVFFENSANDGAITQEIIITLEGDKFAGTIGVPAQLDVQTLPSGLTATASKIDDYHVKITFTGSADNHENDDDQTLTYTFQNGAFVNNANAANVEGYTRNDVKLDFASKASLAYSSSTFNEALSNIGEVSETITITLAGDKFAGTVAVPGQVTIGGLPSNLTAVATRTGDYQVELKLTGSASAHEDINDAPLTVAFLAAAFVNNSDATAVTNYQKVINLDFDNKATLSYAAADFNEDSKNDGSISETVTITLSGDKFAGTVDTPGQVTIATVPSGLTAHVNKTSDTEIDIYFTGKADNHASINNTDLTVTFLDAAFVNNSSASNIVNSSRSDVGLVFQDPAILSYNTNSFIEAAVNDGSINNDIIITLSGDKFAQTVELTTEIDVTVVPSGLTANVSRDNDNQVTISLTGKADNHADINDINLTVQFLDGAFVNNPSASAVTGHTKSDVALNFTDGPSLTYSSTTFKESEANDGSISETIIITLSSDTFVNPIDVGTELLVGGLPGGLTAVSTYNNANQISITFTGAATQHANANDDTITYTFQNGAFTSTATASIVSSYQKNVNLDFNDPAVISYSTNTFKEADANDGSITNSIVLTLSGDIYAETVDLGTEVTVATVPTGLTASVVRTSDTKVTISLTGNAAAHENSNDDTLTITFLNGAFANNSVASAVEGYTRADINIDFEEAAILTYDKGTFNESAANDGTVSETITINLIGDEFNTTFGIPAQIEVTTLPSGLTAAVVRDSATRLFLTLTATADSHLNTDDQDLTVTFKNGAFVNNATASQVTNYERTDIRLNFDDPTSISYSTAIFQEDAANDGSMGNSIVLTLTGDTFNDPITLNTHITVGTVPSGMSAAISRDNDTQVTISLADNASSHRNANDTTVDIEFLNGAFTNTATASNVNNYKKVGVEVDFDNPAVLSYSGTVFNESTSNDGSIANTVTITLIDDEFVGSFAIPTNVTVGGVPTGLTAAVTQLSATQISLYFTGTASVHTNDQDAPLTVTFLNGAFTNNGTASDVDNYLRTDIQLNFDSAASLSYSTGTFKEDTVNDGGLSETVIVTLTGDKFSGSIGIPTQVTVDSNPAGLTAVATKISDTIVHITYNGKADDHEDINDAVIAYEFQNGAFVNNADASKVNGYQKNLNLDFENAATLSYSKNSFNEDLTNDGKISETIILILSGDKFSAGIDIGSGLTIGGEPAGLTATSTRIDDNTLHLKLTGTATDHDAGDSVNLTYTFQNGAFEKNTTASQVVNYLRNDIKINYADPATISYSSNTFKEDDSNDGVISETITITLSGDKFAANIDVGTQLIVSAEPSGLTATSTRISDTVVEINIEGQASVHANLNDTTLTFTFQDNAFVNNATAASVTGYQNANVKLDFMDPAGISYSSGEFNEAKVNNGTITETITLTLSGDTFASTIAIPGQLQVTGMPSGLTAAVNRVDGTEVELTITGTADAHADINDKALTYIFQDGAFVNNTNASAVTNYQRTDIQLNFLDPASLAYDYSSFYEADTNDGAITNDIIITLSGDTFAGSIALTTEVNVGVVPSGLTAGVSRTGDNQVTISLTGKADSHANAQDQDLTITFLNGAFVENTTASTVLNYNRIDVGLDFNDPATLSYSSTRFSEDASNDGKVSETVTITLSGDKFAGTLDIGTGLTVGGVPTGLTANLNLADDFNAEITFTGAAGAHANINDAPLTFTFAGSAFQNTTNASDVDGSTRNDLKIDFIDPATLSYSGNTFNEAKSNDGKITETVTITLSGDKFAGTLDINTGLTVGGVPTGLTANLNLADDYTAEITFTGAAGAHADANDAPLTFTFAASAFQENSVSTNVSGHTRSDIQINFIDPAKLTYTSSKFNEDIANDGSISETIQITLSGDKFAGTFALASELTITGTPTGLTAAFNKDSDTQLSIFFNGAAGAHADLNDAPLTFVFANSAFQNNSNSTNVEGHTRNDLEIDFIDPASLSYSATTFNEAITNVGDVLETITITLTGDKYSAGIDIDTGLTVGGIPTGLTANLSRTNDTNVKIFFTGSAGAHADANDAPLTFTFDATAFENNTVAGNVNNSTKSDMSINFIDPATLTYSSSKFNENKANDGTITETVSITLSGDTYVGGVDIDSGLTVTGVPTGLTANLNRDSATKVSITFTGAAGAHANVNDAPLTFVFDASAFTNNTDATNINNHTRNDLSIDFIDPATLSYSTSKYNEAISNDGKVLETVTITLSGDKFDGAIDIDTGLTVGGVPTGLTANLNRVDDYEIEVTFTGAAGAHANSNDAPLTFTFAASAFQDNSTASNVANSNRSDLSIDFIDPATLSYSTTSFTEVNTNNGSMINSIVITLSGDKFDGTIDLDTDITVGTVPSGLTADITTNSDSQITIALLGNASQHTVGDNTTLTVTFTDTAFVNNSAAANVSGYSNGTVAVNFRNAGTLSYDVSTFDEDVTNDGKISETITITLSDDTFTSNIDVGTQVIVNGVPAGLTADITRISATVLELNLTGAATNHANASDSSITLTFQDSAFTNSLASTVGDYNKVVALDYIDPATLSYSSSKFNENVSNVGQITETVTITLAGDTFAASINLGAEFDCTSLPSGLTADIIRDSGTQLSLTFTTDTADAHANSNDDTFTCTFYTSAFVNNSAASNVTGYNKTDLTIDFIDPASISYSGINFDENVSNTGTITETITLTITGDTFKNPINIPGDLTVAGLPGGLTAVASWVDANTLDLTFTGAATQHANTNDATLTYTFGATAFTNNTIASNVTNYLKNNVTIDFADPATLAYSSSVFNENDVNDGSIPGNIIVTLTGDKFAPTLTQGVHYTISGEPTGLTAVVTRNTDTQLTLTMTGNANPHSDNEDTTLTYTFTADAFVNNTNETNVINYLKNDIAVDFEDAGSLSYSGSTFNENASNIGIVTETITITLSGDTFNGTIDIPTDLTVSGVPSGLTAAVNTVDSTTLELTLTGTASQHTTAQNSPLSYTFQNTAFTNSLASTVGNYQRTDINVIFKDPASLSYSSSTFNEETQNKGGITETIVITLSGDTFAGTITMADHFDCPTVPGGLTATITRNSDTQVTLGFNGSASAHSNDEDTTITCTFEDHAFVNNSLAANVTNYNNTNISINFDDPASISYSSSSFEEDVTNDGAIAESIVITLTGDTFRNPFALTQDLTVVGVPAGLTATVFRVSNTQVRIGLTGKATAHANSNDLDLTYTFQDGAFTKNTDATNVTNYQNTTLGINYSDPAVLSFGSSEFTENLSNVGAFTGETVVITLLGDTFVAGTDLISEGHITPNASLPTGLTAVATRTSDTTLAITLTGQASNHATTNDVSDLTFTFADSAFQDNSLGSNVINYNKNDLKIHFLDPATISYSIGTFTEVTQDGGTIDNSTPMEITLTGDTFNGTIGDDFVADSKLTVTNMPTGLTAVASQTASNKLSVTIVGTATLHAPSNDISDLTFTFETTAFSNNASATNVENYNKTNLAITYNNNGAGAQLLITCDSPCNDAQSNPNSPLTGPIDFGSGNSLTHTLSFTVENIGGETTDALTMSIAEGTNTCSLGGCFDIFTDNCSTLTLNGGDTCTFSVRFRTGTSGSPNNRGAIVTADDGNGVSDTISVTGTGKDR